MSSIKKCIVPGCNTKPCRTDVRWYRFPGHHSLASVVDKGKTVYFSRRRVWLKKLGLDESCLDKNSLICSEHFEEKDIEDSGKGSKLNDNVVPTRNIPQIPFIESEGSECENISKPEPESHENEIETVEKSDDDDDIEIIEPTREIITLDDDDDEGSNREETPKEVLLDKSTKTNEKDENAAKLVTQPLKTDVKAPLKMYLADAKTLHAALTQIASNSAKTTSSTKVTPILTPEKTENGFKTASIVTSEGKKFIVKIASAKSNFRKILPKPETSPADAQNKILKVYENAKKKAEKEKISEEALQVFVAKKIKNSEDTEVSELAKKQLTDLIKRTPLLKRAVEEDISKEAATPKEAPKVEVATDKETAKVEAAPKTKGKYWGWSKGAKRRKKDSNNSSEVESSINESLDGSDSNTKTHCIKQIPKPKRLELLRPSEENPDEFRYVSVEQLLMKGQNQEKEPEVNDIPFGFADIYDFINKYIINFTFDVFGTKYKLKECGLHFETINSNKEKYERKTAIVSNSSLSSSDAYLLNGMNVSLGISNKIFDSNMFKKDITYKKETIKRTVAPTLVPDVSSTSETVNQIPDIKKPEKEETSNVKKVYLEEKVNTPDKSKIVIHPDKFLLLEDKLLKQLDSESTEKKLVVINSNNTKKAYNNEQQILINPESSVSMLNLQEESSDSGNKRIVLHPSSSVLIINKPNMFEEFALKKNKINVNDSDVFVSADKDPSETSALFDEDPLNINEGPSAQSSPRIEKHSGVSEPVKSPDKDEFNKDRRKVIMKKKTGKFSPMARKIFKTPMSQMNPTMGGRLLVGSSKFKKNLRLMQKKEENRCENTDQATIEVTSNTKSSFGSPSTEDKSGKYKTRKFKKDYKSFSRHGTTEDLTLAKAKWKKFTSQSPKKLKYSDKVGDIESFLEVVLEPENKDGMDMEISTSDVTDESIF